ncbi:MAG: TonB-dependent receptor domain-containing protein, partial [Burkholderiales bacterium]
PSGAVRTFDPVTTPNAYGVIPNALASQGSSIGNPLSPGNCAQNGSQYDANFPTCRFNPSPMVPLLPDITRENVAVNFRFKLNEDAEFFLQGFDSHNITDTKEQPSPYSVSFLAGDTAFAAKNIYPAIIMSPSSPYYPTAWLTANSPSTVGSPVTVSYRAFDGGGREHTDTADQSHLVAGFKGAFKNYDYDIAFIHNSSGVAETTQSGYQSMTALASLLSYNNAFNPFTQYQTPALAAQIKGTNYNGQMIDSTLTTNALDGKISGEIMTLPAGPLSFAVGGSSRDENLAFDPSAAFQSGDIAGYGAQALTLNASRHSDSIFGELDIPVLKSLETDIAVRTDRFPNATSTDPKISFRYQPIQTALLRASYGKGFREPGLPELYTPNTLGTTATFLDPVTNVRNQFTQTTGGNPDLKPEKSEQASFGIVLDPVKGLSMSVDYYQIRITNLVTTLNPEFTVDQAAAGNPAYAGLVTRDSLGNITNIMATNINAGSEKTSGFDVDVRWQIAKTADYGNYNLHLNGTYVSKFDLTNPDGSVQHSVAATVDSNGNALNVITNGGIIFRWKHVLNLDWAKGPYAVDLTQNFQSGYWDNIPCCTAQTTPDHIGAFTTWDMQASYSGYKNLLVSAGVKNLFDRNPPVAITQGQYFQAGWDPTYYDPHSQFVYVNAKYKF